MIDHAQKEYHTPKKSAEKEKSIHLKNNIPMQMKRRFENLSGLSFDDVRVNYKKNDISSENEADATYNRKQVYKMPYNHNGNVVQLYSISDGYTVGNYSYDMICEGPDPDFDGSLINGQDNKLAILYEIIVYDKEASKVINNFVNTFKPGTRRNDVALSLVVNHNADDNIEPDSPIRVESSNDPLINVERVIWGIENSNAKKDEEYYSHKKDIPYYSLRRRAAINPGAWQLEVLLKNHSDNVWRKMCDSDAVFHDPMDSADKQMDIMKGIASSKYFALKMVTFGYILETPSNDYDEILDEIEWFKQLRFNKEQQNSVREQIKERLNPFIDSIYRYEAEFRMDLFKNGLILPSEEKSFDFYPCEPSTYYRFNEYESPETIEEHYWKGYSKQQIAEGRTFKKYYIPDAKGKDRKHGFVPRTDALERTGAGRRHKEFIGVLLNHFVYDKDNNQIKCIISKMELYNQIRSLSQSYFNPSTHSLKSDEIAPFVNRVNEFLDAKPLYEDDPVLLHI